MKSTIISHLSTDYPWKDHFHFFPELSSTNDLLKTMAKEGAPHGTAILADRQTGL